MCFHIYRIQYNRDHFVNKPIRTTASAKSPIDWSELINVSKCVFQFIFANTRDTYMCSLLLRKSDILFTFRIESRKMALDDVVGYIIQQYFNLQKEGSSMSRFKLPCTRCQTMVSTTWRPGPCGTSSLCNTCGVLYMQRSTTRPRMVDLVLNGENKPVWLKRDNSTFQWYEDSPANTKDKRIAAWSRQESERVQFTQSQHKKRKIARC